MNLLWDEHKRLANLEKHSLDFSDVVEFGWDDAIIKPTRAGKFGGSNRRLLDIILAALPS